VEICLTLAVNVIFTKSVQTKQKVLLNTKHTAMTRNRFPFYVTVCSPEE